MRTEPGASAAVAHGPFDAWDRERAHLRVSTLDAPVTRAVLVLLVGASLVVHALAWDLERRGIAPGIGVRGALTMGEVRGGDDAIWRYFSAPLLHASLLHLATNAALIWIFGRVAEVLFGLHRYVLLLGVSALAGCVGSVVWTPGAAVGASAALFGILGGLVGLVLVHAGRLPRRLRGGLGISAVAVVAVATFGGGAELVPDHAAHAHGGVAGLLLGAFLRPATFDAPPPSPGLRIAFRVVVAATLWGALMVPAEAWRCGRTAEHFAACVPSSEGPVQAQPTTAVVHAD